MNRYDDLPLQGLLVVDLSQFLAGPLAGLKLADMGARVIKIERPGRGDLCRQLYVSSTEIGGDSTVFHAINRNKESFAADLKNPTDHQRVCQLIKQADVVIQNFRPGVIERLELDYQQVRAFKPDIIYGSISGYGEQGPWRDRPGQDLLAQARSGLLWLSGDRASPPTPVGLPVADMLAGNNLAQGILAALVRRGINGRGCKVETSLLEALLDFQFEVLTTYFNDGQRLPDRSDSNNAHAYLAAPYGVYQTADGYLALAMTPAPGKLAELLGIERLAAYSEPKSWFEQRDEIKRIIQSHLRQHPTQVWLDKLQPADIWCAEIRDWPSLFAHEGFKVLEMTQHILRDDGVTLTTTRNPLRFDDCVLKSSRAAPRIGQHTEAIIQEFGL